MNQQIRGMLAFLIVALAARGAAVAADWNQWRGPGRDGVDRDSPPLLDRLPEGGLKPVWSSPKLPGAGGGGWSSPIVAGGKVFLYCQRRAENAERELPPPEYPSLTKERKAEMSDGEIKEYEQLRGEEDAERRRKMRYEDRVYCLDASSGELLWSSVYPSRYTQFSQSGSPAVVAGRLVYLGGGRTARCLNVEDGKEVWHTRLPGTFKDECYHSSFAIADGVAAVFAGKLFALDVASGKLLWQSEEPETRDLHSSPIVWEQGGKPRFIAPLSRREIACLEPRSGEEVWRVQADLGQATLLLTGDRLIAYGRGKKSVQCWRITEEEAKTQWTYSGISDDGSSPVAIGGRLFVQGGKHLACLELESGEPVWTSELALHDPRYTSLIAAGDKAIYALDGLLVFSAKGDEYRELWRLKLPRGPVACTSPALVDGRLYLRTDSGVACYDLRQGE